MSASDIKNPNIKDKKQDREAQLHDWFAGLTTCLPELPLDQPLEKVSGDASFRRYFRAYSANQSYILVDAPPEQENSALFVDLAQRLLAAGVCVPQVLAADFKTGFMCLSDMGNTLLWEVLEQARLGQDFIAAGAYYHMALTELLKIALITPVDLPDFDESMLQREMDLFHDWLCKGILGLELNEAELTLWQEACDHLIESARAQPQVFVHRDYHSRNLMLSNDSALGVIDFQDAVRGPLTYDLVSLLKDCYIDWPAEFVEQLARSFYDLCRQHSLIIENEFNEATFMQSFQLMGIQRHLKASGIFCRLCLRDGKPGYLDDIPRTVNYIVALAGRFPELDGFISWLQNRVLPGLPAALKDGKARAGKISGESW